MLEFAHPLALLLLPAAPLVTWSWLRRRRTALRWPDTRPLATLPNGRADRARWTGAILRGFVVAAVVLAIAGPRWPDEGSRLPAEGVAVVVALDVSGSMAEHDFTWDGQPISRLQAAQKAIQRFIRGDNEETNSSRAGDAIGLVAFAAQPEDTCPLTLSHDVLIQLLNAETPRGLPDSGTNIGDAMVWGLKKLEAAGNRHKVLILVSDGEHNAPAPALTPRQAAQLAGHEQVPIYTINAGPPTGAAVRPEDEAARRAGERELEAVAEMTGGRNFVAHDSAAMSSALSEIDRLERRPIESFVYRRYHEAFPALAIAAFAFLAMVLGLEATFWRRVPVA